MLLLVSSLLCVTQAHAMFTVPNHCIWALKSVFIPQRCAKQSCNVKNRNDLLGEVQVFGNYSTPGVAEKINLPTLDEWPTCRPRIVDIGAGLAMYHVKIHRYYRNHSIHYIVDRSANISTHGGKYTSHGGFHASAVTGGSFPFYSSLECAADIVRANGFPNANHFRTVNAEKGAIAALGDASVDLVMSVLSWGFHYPISTYADEVRRVLKPVSGRLIIQGVKDTAGMAKAFTCNAQETNRCCVGCRDPKLPPNHPDNAAPTGTR
jgi:hypothetical protein